MTRLALQELAEPFEEDAASHVDGVTRAVALLDIQQQVLRRTRLGGTAEPPRRDQMVLVCDRVDSAGGTTLAIGREHLGDVDRYCGWFVGCLDPEHHHTRKELLGVHLLHIVRAYPWIFPYLYLPAGSFVFRHDDGVSISVRDTTDGVFDSAPLFTLPFAL